MNAAAGEEIYVLDLATTPRPPELVDEDFWLLDEEYVLRMIYDTGGKFVGAEQADSPQPYRAARDAALAASEEFGPWWARHPDEWRASWQRAT